MGRFSWIITIIWCYLLSILVYVLMDSTKFWWHYYWIDTSLICIAGFLFNFIKRKTIKEIAYILFVVLLKAFNLLYYIIGLLIGSEIWMRTNIYFLIVMAISSFIAFIYYKSWKEN